MRASLNGVSPQCHRQDCSERVRRGARCGERGWDAAFCVCVRVCSRMCVLGRGCVATQAQAGCVRQRWLTETASAQGAELRVAEGRERAKMLWQGYVRKPYLDISGISMGISFVHRECKV